MEPAAASVAEGSQLPDAGANGVINEDDGIFSDKGDDDDTGGADVAHELEEGYMSDSCAMEDCRDADDEGLELSAEHTAVMISADSWLEVL